MNLSNIVKNFAIIFIVYLGVTSLAYSAGYNFGINDPSITRWFTNKSQDGTTSAIPPQGYYLSDSYEIIGINGKTFSKTRKGTPRIIEAWEVYKKRVKEARNVDIAIFGALIHDDTQYGKKLASLRAAGELKSFTHSGSNSSVVPTASTDYESFTLKNSLDFLTAVGAETNNKTMIAGTAGNGYIGENYLKKFYLGIGGNSSSIDKPETKETKSFSTLWLFVAHRHILEKRIASSEFKPVDFYVSPLILWVFKESVSDDGAIEVQEDQSECPAFYRNVISGPNRLMVVPTGRRHEVANNHTVMKPAYNRMSYCENTLSVGANALSEQVNKKGTLEPPVAMKPVFNNTQVYSSGAAYRVGFQSEGPGNIPVNPLMGAMEVAAVANFTGALAMVLSSKTAIPERFVSISKRSTSGDALVRVLDAKKIIKVIKQTAIYTFKGVPLLSSDDLLREFLDDTIIID
jgi:hypothetical protein